MAEAAKAEMAKRKEITKEVFGPDYFTIEAQRCALLVIDMQNSFVEEGAIFEAPKGREIIPNINRIVEKARELGVAVIWTQSDHSPPGGGLILERYPVIKTVERAMARRPQSPPVCRHDAADRRGAPDRQTQVRCFSRHRHEHSTKEHGQGYRHYRRGRY